jgi:zinc/manganese transport system permease protein
VSDALALLWAPFLVALCLVGIHTYFGIQVLARNVIFVDLALAQVAALGTTVAFMLGHAIPSPAAYAYSLAFTLLAALLLAFTRQWSGRIPQEALIGIIYVVTAAAAILLIDRAPQGAEHLKQILTGNVLTTGLTELTAIVPLYAAIGVLHWMLRRRVLATSDGAWMGEFLFYATFGAVVTSSVALAGVLLVFSFLIIPAAIGVLYSDRFGRQLAIGWTVGAFASGCGLGVSYVADLPTGAAMVCTFGVAIAVAGLLHPFLRGDARAAWRRLLLACRIALSLALAASAIALIALPRADQPLLDTIEAIAPSVRDFYLYPRESAVYRDADAHAERYRAETERLNAMEVQSRTEGKALDDAEVRRISSFLKSYNEMRRGEEFVKREVRSRARERTRWIVGITAILLALMFVPGLAGGARDVLERRRRA